MAVIYGLHITVPVPMHLTNEKIMPNIWIKPFTSDY